MNLLLDTHAFIWWDDDYNRLPLSVIAALHHSDNVIYLSLVSIWEMQIKLQLGKLKFEIPLSQKVQEQQATNKIQLLPITDTHIYGLDALPHHHRDPFDRLLIAQARTGSLQLVTHDANIGKYDVQILWNEK